MGPVPSEELKAQEPEEGEGWEGPFVRPPHSPPRDGVIPCLRPVPGPAEPAPRCGLETVLPAGRASRPPL